MSDSEEEFGFKINKDYADRYNKWRRKEELQKFKDRYGADVDDVDESSSSESEDEDAEALTEQLEKDWLTTLAALKSKDPKIYEEDVKFYQSEESSTSSADGKVKEKKQKPVFLKDYERNQLLKKTFEVEDSDSEHVYEEAYKPGYYEEQQNIVENLKATAGDDSSDDELLVRRKKTEDEKEEEDKDFADWLTSQPSTSKGHNKQYKDAAQDAAQDEGDGETFLKNYIIKRQYLEKDKDRIPTYEEIVGDEDLSEEDRELDAQEQFEKKVNFRFEDPDPEFIKTYPRFIENSVRRKDTSRKEKRHQLKERKEKEKEQKFAELKQLKNLKKQEIQEKLAALGQIAGDAQMKFTNIDIDGDFNPEEHDQLMQEMFNEDYYGHDDDDGDEKPVWPDDEELQDENWDEWTGPAETDNTENSDEPEKSDVPEKSDELHCEDPGFNMDADYVPEDDDRVIDPTKRKKKKKSKFARLVEKKKPVFDPNDKTFAEYLEEYYKLDFEDMIEGQPTRFPYRQVPALDFGLSTGEILTAPDRELNSWMSLKKIVQYRSTEEEMYDKKFLEKKARSYKKKLNILPSLSMENNAEEPKPKKKRRRRNRKRNASELLSTSEGQGSIEDETETKQPNTGNDAKKRKLDTATEEETSTESKKQKTQKDTKVNNETASSPGKSKKKKKVVSKQTGNPSVEKKTSVPVSSNITIEESGQSKAVQETKKDGKKKKRNKKQKQKKAVMSEERVKAYGFNPKNFKYIHGDKVHVQKSS